MYHKKKLNLPSGSSGGAEPNWAFWKDFSKFEKTQNERPLLSSLDIDDNFVFDAHEKDGNIIIDLNESLVCDPPVVAPSRKRKKSPDATKSPSVGDLMQILGAPDKEKSPIVLARESVLNGISALLGSVHDVRTVIRLGQQITNYTMEILPENN